jgi:Fe-S oxidoreductase
MMGQRKAARDTARQNVLAFEAAGVDYVVTLCASCASHIKHKYPEILSGDPELKAKAESFAGKIIDFSSLLRDVLKFSSDDLKNDGEKVAYHAPCHLCRGLGVTAAPRELLAAGGQYLPTPEEDVCCGFGGTYSVKFPEISATLLAHKLEGLENSEAVTLVTDCPGCVMQLKGGEEKRGNKIKVEHMAEFLDRHLK